MGKEMMKQADDWLKSMLEIASEQKEAEMIEHMKQRIKVQKWLMEQAEQNKRYREAIERAVKRLNGIYAENHEVALVYVELAGVLEGESSEGN